ncbi:uncharacterized protein LOC129779810 [Toxorhynchites rutilus septentrionalis]|uniref:uncharacterized protein LOC129779810 n=1 Tax=Toxorhynchites rutilus septentrionalis TaxID=329112 RepID=UPI002479B49E|nr:uncharacterized protein LOC129779810 [Toxorhynchites rutilus septentrionalis]
MRLDTISTLVIGSVLLVLIISEINCNVHDLDRNDLSHDINDQRARPAGRGFTDNAKDLLASPAGQLAVSFAKEMISRSVGNSQVLSLNLSNLLILFLLKALIFAAGLIGAGNWGQYARGRSEDGTLFQPGETGLMLGYLAAEGSGQEGCMLQSACRSPRTANEYARAAHALVKGAEIFDPEIPKNGKYNRMLLQLDRAVMEGLQGAPCEMIYPCHLY